MSFLLVSQALYAQVPGDDLRPPTHGDPSGGTKIPIGMPDHTEVLGAEGVGTSSLAPPIALEQPIDPDTYVCGPGDVLELNFWGQQNFRLRAAVDLEGRLFISKVGFLAVSGKTLTTVRAAVTKKVRTVYPGLSFEVALVAPRTFVLHVVENVKNPGSYSAHPFERVSTVLARAGGVTGSKRQIKIRRGSNTLTADLVLYELTGDVKHNPFVLDGDVIIVPSPDITVEVSGAIRRPGKYELVAGKDLAELIGLAGGFTAGVATSLPIRVMRRDSSERLTFIDVAFNGNMPAAQTLRDDDRVFVRGAEEYERSVLLIGAVVGSDPADQTTSTKRLPFVEGDTVLSLIERSGGIKAPGDLRRAYISRPRKNAEPQLVALDLEALLVARDFHADKPVAMGDTIVIPPMQYSVLVEGAVRRPGLYNFNPLLNVPEYIARAGGRTRSAQDIDDVKVIDAAGATHDFKPGMKTGPGDAILVPERSITRSEVVQLVLAGAGLLLSGAAVWIAASR